MMRVKICGMSSVEDVLVCADAGADALGFVFAQSPRKLAPGSARALTDAVPAFVTTVGVFANDSRELVHEVLGKCRLDVLQFSGDESPEFCGSFGKPTILATRGRQFTPEEIATARAVAILVDSWQPTQYGGTGRTIDAGSVAKARAHSPDTPVILAGGLTPRNVAALIRASHPNAVDARTGIEIEGCKDPDLVRDFVTAARGALVR